MKEICQFSNTSDPPHLATQHIVWGCLNQHVHDFPICRYHIYPWEQQFNRDVIYCLSCPEQAAEYLVDTRGMGL